MLVIYLPNGSKLWDMLVMEHIKGFPLLCSFYWVYNLAILHCLSFHLLHVQNSCWHSNQFKCNILWFLSLSFKFYCPCRWCHIHPLASTLSKCFTFRQRSFWTSRVMVSLTPSEHLRKEDEFHNNLLILLFLLESRSHMWAEDKEIN